MENSQVNFSKKTHVFMNLPLGGKRTNQQAEHIASHRKTLKF